MKGQRAQQLVEVETLHRILGLDVIHDYRMAIDVGANVGTWSVVMASYFNGVIAFEANPDTYAVLAGNTADFGNIDPRCTAVMDRRARVTIFPPRPGKTSAGWQVDFDKQGETRSIAIDDLGMESCGLIKLDIEGAELLALRGAAETIRRCRPVLVVEVGGLASRFGHSERAVHGHILSSGYRELFRSGVDRVFVPN